jgi:hypothetical protein
MRHRVREEASIGIAAHAWEHERQGACRTARFARAKAWRAVGLAIPTSRSGEIPPCYGRKIHRVARAAAAVAAKAPKRQQRPSTSRLANG